MLKPALALICASLAASLSACSTIGTWEIDHAGASLEIRETNYVFEIEGARAREMGCAGFQMCPGASALLAERMKLRSFCGGGYNVNSVGWNPRGRFYAVGYCRA